MRSAANSLRLSLALSVLLLQEAAHAAQGCCGDACADPGGAAVSLLQTQAKLLHATLQQSGLAHAEDPGHHERAAALQTREGVKQVHPVQTPVEDSYGAATQPSSQLMAAPRRIAMEQVDEEAVQKPLHKEAAVAWPELDLFFEHARGPLADGLLRSIYTMQPRQPKLHQFDRQIWHQDVFASHNKTNTAPHTHMFGTTLKQKGWISLGVVIVVLLLLDIFVLRRFTLNAGVRTHFCILSVWLAVAVIFAVGIFIQAGDDLGWQWCSGYILEWLLSMDNLFVFHIVFKAFVTPPKLLHKALFFGIFGCCLFRMIFFVALHNLLDLHWVFKWTFGAILIYSGIQAARDDDDEMDDPTASLPVRMLRTLLGDRLCDDYDEPAGRLFIVRDGKWTATLMVPVIFFLEITDIVFAIDSVSAKTAQIPDQFMNYSSTCIAMFGLRAMFFIIDDIMKYFEYMKYGLCAILIFIGLELCFSDYVTLPAIDMCIILIAVFFMSIIASSVKAYFYPDVSDESSECTESTVATQGDRPAATWK